MSNGAQQTGNESPPNEYYTGGHESYHNQVMPRRTADSHAAFFLPYLRSGMSLIDCGCGPGTITLGLAETVSPAQVIGIDIGESGIESANSLAKQRGLTNAEFRVGNVYELPFLDNSFDAAFAHGVLEHLGDPSNALVEMRRVLKPGGLIGVRSPDYGGHIYAPVSPVMDESLSLIEKVVAHNGGNRRIGRHLRAMLREAGFTKILGSATYEFDGTQEMTRFEGDVMAGIFAGGQFHDQVVELGWAADSELREMAASWTSWGDHPDAFRASTWCEAVGWKE